MTDQERIDEYKEKIDYKPNSSRYVEYKHKIGDYALSRLSKQEDTYNHAYVEENCNYIFDKNGVPYLLCETQAGNANNNASSENEIKENDALLSEMRDILVFILMSKKLPYIKYRSLGKDLEGALDTCFKMNDFSRISLSNCKEVDRKVIEAMVKKYESMPNLYGYEKAIKSRGMKTPTEMYGNIGENKALNN